MLAALEHRARDDHRRRNIRHRADRTRAPPRSIHHRRARLDGSIARERGSDARTKLGILFEHAHRSDDRIERSPAALENVLPGLRRGSNALPQTRLPIWRHRASTTVHDDHEPSVTDGDGVY